MFNAVVMEKEYELPNQNREGRLEDPSTALSYGDASTVFNPVQHHLLRMFAFDGSEERLEEVKRVLAKHFSELMDRGLEELWDAGVLDQEKLDELRDIDLRKL